jgi:ABC-type transport system involved in cytochrome c biogenesis permease subunit
LFVFIVIILQIISTAFRAGYMILRKMVDPVSPFIDACSGLLLLAELIYRSFLIHFPAVTCIYEALILLVSVFLITIAFLQLSRKTTPLPSLPFISGITVLLLLFFSITPGIYRDISSPAPVLQSFWLIFHVTFSVIGESLFFIAFITSVLSLVSKTKEKIRRYDTLSSTIIIAGYVFFTTGALLFGALWAEQAWGNYWSWDPKETWALITALVYTLYLHMRYTGKWNRKTRALVSITGFIFTLFMLFGVNYFLKGYHRY